MPESPPNDPAADAPASEPAEPAAMPAAPAPLAIEPGPSRLKSTPWVTIAIIAANVAVWLVTLALGASPIEPSSEWLIEHGGNLGAVTLDGEPWRLFTSMFLHIGVMHLAMNMIGLMTGGQLVERLFGRLGFATIYLISGLVGSLASALRPVGVVSVGASGAIFGVLGAHVAYYALHRERLDQRIARDSIGLLVVVAYNLVLGFTTPGIDMRAHLGGLAAGFLCGLALELRLVPGARRLLRTAAVGAVGLAVVIAAALAAPAPVDEPRAINAFAAVEGQVIARWGELVDQAQRQEITDDALAGAIERDILGPWRAARDEFARRDAGGARREALLEYMRLREEGWATMARGLHAHDGAAMQRGMQRLQDAAAVARKALE
jgi:rhomboid protease GluP